MKPKTTPLRLVGVAAHVDQARLDDGVAIRGHLVVTARNDIGLKNVLIAQDVLLAVDVDQRAQVIRVGQVVGRGMEAKAREFAEKGNEIYAKAPNVINSRR